jgi:hypothetical protein
MCLGWLLGYSLPRDERPVIVVEAGVRNIAVALVLGTAILPDGSFNVLATFLTGYLLVEIAIMLGYARWLHSAK